MERDFAYYSRRAQAEREAAMKARHPDARRAHLELAKRYDELADAPLYHNSPPGPIIAV